MSRYSRALQYLLSAGNAFFISGVRSSAWIQYGFEISARVIWRTIVRVRGS